MRLTTWWSSPTATTRSAASRARSRSRPARPASPWPARGADGTTILAPQGFRDRLLSIGDGSGLAVTGLTLDGNYNNQGGNVSVGDGATVTLDRVHVTRGQAIWGGGLNADRAAAVTIRSSLFDNNSATYDRRSTVLGAVCGSARRRP